LASSFAASNLLSELFGNAAFSTSASVTMVVTGAFHPTAFAWCVFWQFLALKFQTLHIGIALASSFASLGSDESAFVVLVATVQRLALLVVAGGRVASSLKFFELWCIFW